eukprot:232747_1
MPIKKLLTELPPRTFTRFASHTGSIKLKDTMQRLSQHFGDNLPATMSEEELSIPDTKIAINATKLSSSLIPKSIVEHSIRSYKFGVAIAKHLNELKEIDKEQLYLSCILHDIG